MGLRDGGRGCQMPSSNGGITGSGRIILNAYGAVK